MTETILHTTTAPNGDLLDIVLVTDAGTGEQTIIPGRKRKPPIPESLRRANTTGASTMQTDPIDPSSYLSWNDQKPKLRGKAHDPAKPFPVQTQGRNRLRSGEPVAGGRSDHSRPSGGDSLRSRSDSLAMTLWRVAGATICLVAAYAVGVGSGEASGASQALAQISASCQGVGFFIADGMTFWCGVKP